MPIDLQILSSLEAIRLPVLDQIFLFITDIGIAPFLLPFFCLIYWNLNKKAGEFLAFSFFLTMLTNQLLKITFCIDRPWVRNPDMNPVDAAIPAATGYSFPSGHTSNTTAIFGGIGLWFKNRLLRILCFVIIALVAFSRLYLGVHTPEDVLVAMIIGFSAIFVSKKLLEWLSKNPEKDITVLVTVLIVCILATVYTLVKPYPEGSNVGLRLDSIKTIGIVIGGILGWFWERRAIRFSHVKNIWLNIAIFVFGIAILLVIQTYTEGFLNSIFGDMIGNLLRNSLCTFWIMGLYPFIFSNLIKKFNIKTTPANVEQ